MEIIYKQTNLIWEKSSEFGIFMYVKCSQPVTIFMFLSIYKIWLWLFLICSSNMVMIYLQIKTILFSLLTDHDIFSSHNWNHISDRWKGNTSHSGLGDSCWMSAHSLKAKQSSQVSVWKQEISLPPQLKQASEWIKRSPPIPTVSNSLAS